MKVENDELGGYLLDIAKELEQWVDSQPDPGAKLALQIAANILKAYPQLTTVEQVSINLIGAGMLANDVAQEVDDLRIKLGSRDLMEQAQIRCN